jgi:dienelactone hydrolase
VKRNLALIVIGILASAAIVMAAPPQHDSHDTTAGGGPGIASLKHVSIDGLRQREFGSTVQLEDRLGSAAGESAYSQSYGAPYYNTYMASYHSDGLRVYTRVDIPPTSMPPGGYPVIIFAHGWVGASGAPTYRFNYSAGSYYGDEIDAWVKAGYVVLMPGFRGHGTVKGVPAEGLDYIKAYDNGSYLSPIFYAIDILNLLEGVDSLNHVNWRRSGYPNGPGVRIDKRRIFLTGHSQGGDAALTALVVSSSPHLRNTFAGASIFNGCFEGRIEQGAFYGPQENAFGVQSDPAYYPHMPYWWVGDDSWYWLSIDEAIAYKKDQMYTTVRTYVADQKHADPDANSLVTIMAGLDAYKHAHYIKVPLDLHYSDWDYYSIPSWNATLVRKIRSLGGTSNAFLYPGNAHELDVDPFAVCVEYSSTLDANHYLTSYTPQQVACKPGRATAIQRTIDLFNGIQ